MRKTELVSKENYLQIWKESEKREKTVFEREERGCRNAKMEEDLWLMSWKEEVDEELLRRVTRESDKSWRR